MRQVLKIMDASQHEEVVCAGLGEAAALRLASEVRDQQVGAWLREHAGLPHEPLAGLVLADGLDEVPGGQCVWYPRDIALGRLAKLTGVWREIEAHRYAHVAGRTLPLRSDPWTRAARLGVRVYPRAGSVCLWPRASVV